MILDKNMYVSVGFLLASVHAASAREVAYTCNDGSILTATFSAPVEAPGSVTLVIAGVREPITLPQVLSADGGRCADDDAKFWIKGRDATLKRPNNTVSCKAG
jgi:membrane-bound inhibitor of C-type lysozyme